MKFAKARQLVCSKELITHTSTSDSRSMLIPLLLLIPIIHFLGGVHKVMEYGKLLMIGLISPHIALVLIFLIEDYVKDYSNLSDNEIIHERINFLEEFALAWYSIDESKFIRFGFFIIFLLGSYIFMWYSIILNKPIEYFLFKYVKFGIILDKNHPDKIDLVKKGKRSMNEITQRDLVKLKSDGRVDQWTDFAKKEIINIYLNIRKVSNSSDADCRRKATEEFGKKFKHVLAIVPNPNSLYKWLNY